MRRYEIDRTYCAIAYRLVVWRCPRCRFLFLHPPPQVAYDETYLHEEGVATGEDPAARFRASERLKDICRRTGRGEARRFLDIGVGDGLVLAHAEACGYEAFGLDVNPAAARLARDVRGVKAPIVLEPVDAAFPGQLFDVIHMNEVIEHLADPLALLRWCAAHLSPRGVVVIQTGNVDSVAARLKGRRWDYFRPAHVSYFSTRTLRAATARAGLRVTRVRTTDWTLRGVVQTCRTLARCREMARGVRLVITHLTSRVHGVRRTVLIHAVRSDHVPDPQ